MLNGLRLALSFLTTVPILETRLLGAKYEYKPEHWSAAAIWFPIIGAGLGAGVALVAQLATTLYSDWLAAVLAVVVWAVLTGGLHLDGLADCCDGLFAMTTPERRLEILRDPRVGAFGAIGLVLFLLLKTAAVHEVLANGNNWLPLILATVLARYGVLIIARQSPARKEGLGVVFAKQIQLHTLLFTALIPIGLSLLNGWTGFIALSAASLVMWGLIRLVHRRLGGVTGDVFGFGIELVELTTLLAISV